MHQTGLNEQTIKRWVGRVEAEFKRETVPHDFPTLPPIPPGRYNNERFFEIERERLWRRTWVYAAHADQLRETGDYLVWPHGSAPIVLIRGDDGEVRAFYNTCRHRGAPVVRDAAGHAAKTLVCGYHGWTYNRHGELLAVTEGRDWRDLDRSCHSLVPVRCESLGNWIFLCERDDVEPLNEFLAPISRFFAHLSLEEFRLISRRVIDVKCNVKVLIENFLEAYHFNLLHPRTTHRIFDNRGTNVHLWRNGHSMMLSPNRRPDWIDPGTLGMPEISGATRIERDFNPSYCVHPNLILPIAPSGIPGVAMWPKTPTTSCLEVLWFAPRKDPDERDPLWETRIANFDRIVDEDIQLAEPMQETIQSRGFRGVPISYQERRIYHWHAEADKRIGAEVVPAELRLPPLLDQFVE